MLTSHAIVIACIFFAATQPPTRFAQQDPVQRAIDEIVDIGGTVDFEEHQGLKSRFDINLADTIADDRIIDALNNIPDLRALNTIRSNVTDTGLLRLTNLSGIGSLRIGNTKIGRGLLERVCTLRRLVDLVMLDAGLCDDDLDGLNNLKELELLALQDNEITDRGVSKLTGLISLKVLDICNTRISNEGTREIMTNMHNLEQLELAGNQIGDVGLREVGKLARLRELNLGRTNITDATRQGPKFT